MMNDEFFIIIIVGRFIIIYSSFIIYHSSLLKMYLKKSFIIILFSLCVLSIKAQVVGDLLQITLQDQSSIKGKLIEKKGDDWVIETKSVGNVSLKRADIVHFEVLKTTQIGSFKQLAPPTYCLTHTAIPLEKGEGYYQASELVFHSVIYGFTKYLSVSAGFEIASYFDNNASRQKSLPVLGYVSPRLSYCISPNFYLSTGILIGRDERGSFFNGVTNALNVLYATATFGNRNSNLSFTYGHRLEKIPKVNPISSIFPPPDRQNMNFISVAGKIRLSESWTIISEAWSWTSAFSFPSARTSLLGFGARYTARKFNVGFGILAPLFEDTLDESIPLLTFGVPF